MKKELKLTIAALVIIASVTLMSFKKSETSMGSYRIAKVYADGRTFYVLEDSYGNAVNFIEKK